MLDLLVLKYYVFTPLSWSFSSQIYPSRVFITLGEGHSEIFVAIQLRWWIKGWIKYPLCKCLFWIIKKTIYDIDW